MLLPEDFYSASILNQKVEEPCVIGGNQLCRDYSYPIISDFDVTWGNGGYTSGGTPTDYYTVYEVSILNKKICHIK